MNDNFNTMHRRSFLKGVGALGISTLLSSYLNASTNASSIDFNNIEFDRDLYERNNAQTIILFLYGGPSELAGNLTNIEEINHKSQNPYPIDDEHHFRFTRDNFWGNAGGDILQEMLDNNDLNLFRTCFRTVNDLKAHEKSVSQAQRGHDTSGGAGIIANLAAILDYNGALSQPDGTEIGKNFPFVTLEGSSTFFSESSLKLAPYLKASAFSAGSVNPYERNGIFDKRILDRTSDSTLGELLDTISQRHNRSRQIKDAFMRRPDMARFVNDVNDEKVPDGVVYPPDNPFAENLEFAMKLLLHNPYTKVVSIGSPGYGTWDDHSDALDEYIKRMCMLMEAINAAIQHMVSAGRDNINILVFGEFGRNVNYNNSFGWDHGNNQNIYWFGGKNYLNRLGIVGETALTGEGTRLYLRPKNFGTPQASYHFQVFSGAATIYNLYGITNPEILTNNNGVIEGLIKS